MKKIAFLIVLVLTYMLSFSQETSVEKKLKTQSKDTTEGWKIGGIASLNFSQTSLTHWSAGGLNSITINGLFGAYATYRKNGIAWENTLDLGYGLLQQGEKKDVLKTDDKIDFSSKIGKKAYKKLYYAGFMNFRTQMTPGYNYPNDSVPISNLLAPAYFIAALGLDYTPNNDFGIFLAPITVKTTIVNDKVLSEAGAFGVDKGEIIRTEYGGYLRLFYKRKVMKNVNLSTKIDLFSNYLNNPQNIDVNWELLLSMKINKYMTATISTLLIYDDDIKIAWIDDNNINHVGPTIQFKEILGVGLSYKF